MRSAYVVSPLEAITTAANEIGAQVDHSFRAGVNLNLTLEASKLASSSDLAIVIDVLPGKFETEGFDRKDMEYVREYSSKIRSPPR